MGDMGELWNAIREERAQRNEAKRHDQLSDILFLEFHGLKVRELTPFQFRVNERLDLYPTSGKWHDVEMNKRGIHEGSLGAFAWDFFGCPPTEK